MLFPFLLYLHFVFEVVIVVVVIVGVIVVVEVGVGVMFGRTSVKQTLFTPSAGVYNAKNVCNGCITGFDEV